MILHPTVFTLHYTDCLLIEDVKSSSKLRAWWFKGVATLWIISSEKKFKKGFEKGQSCFFLGCWKAVCLCGSAPLEVPGAQVTDSLFLNQSYFEIMSYLGDRGVVRITHFKHSTLAALGNCTGMPLWNVNLGFCAVISPGSMRCVMSYGLIPDWF